LGALLVRDYRTRRNLGISSWRVDSNSTRWWYWTVGLYGFCDRCGTAVEGSTIAYESGTRTVLCGACAEDVGVASECVESRRARRARQLRLIEAAEEVATLAGTAA
jgi:hypothetical protein